MAVYMAAHFSCQHPKMTISTFNEAGVFGASLVYHGMPALNDAGADVPTVLAVGGPLTNSASLTRQGGDLVMRYQLIGEGGQTYNLMNVDRSKPPQYAIYQGGEKIALGSFEFG